MQRFGKVDIQAQTGEMDLVADKTMKKSFKRKRPLKSKAAEEIVLTLKVIILKLPQKNEQDQGEFWFLHQNIRYWGRSRLILPFRKILLMKCLYSKILKVYQLLVLFIRL